MVTKVLLFFFNSPVNDSVDKESNCNAGDTGDMGSIPGSGSSLGQEDLLKEEMATNSSILTWKIPWAEEPEELDRGSKELDTTEQLRMPN